MPLALLDAFVADDRAAIARLAPYAVPATFPGEGERRDFVRFRRDQLRDDPARYPWSLRAMVLRAERRMVGFVNFHGKPGTNDTGTAGAVELGWTVFDADQRRGYATETAIRLIEWARQAHGIQRFISSTTPDNTASLRVHHKLGFVPTGEVVDGELIFELPADAAARTGSRSPR